MTDRNTYQIINETIVEATKSAKSEVMPEMSDKIKKSLLEAINEAVVEGIKQIKTTGEKEVSENVESAERRCKLETISKAELLECYNRRDNITVVGVTEDRSSDNKVMKAIDSEGRMSFN